MKRAVAAILLVQCYLRPTVIESPAPGVELFCEACVRSSPAAPPTAAHVGDNLALELLWRGTCDEVNFNDSHPVSCADQAFRAEVRCRGHACPPAYPPGDQRGRAVYNIVPLRPGTLELEVVMIREGGERFRRAFPPIEVVP